MTEPSKSEKFSWIVGIGASAGGLEPLQGFLSTLPKEFEFALVFVQHLPAQHKSLLPELLHAKEPTLVIEEISDGQAVLPGRLYLCPPGREVRIRKGLFHLTRHPKGLIHLPIDEFFASLAEDAADHGIAVILSGAGTDGARGSMAIRDAGGAVFVQEPATAEFSSMPLAAIAAGHADAVLPPQEIAREIQKVVASGAVTAAKLTITNEEYDSFFRALLEKTGSRFVHYKKSVLSRRIKRRMFLHGISTVKEYLDLVSTRDAEAAALAADLMIGVTSFFRDRVAWRALNNQVVRKLAAEDTDRPVRIWTPASATGEEAYSITMMLTHELSLAGKKREIMTFATDVNALALEKARDGRYLASISADVPEEYLQKYFTLTEDGHTFSISKEIRERVVFARHDLLSDPPFSRLDLIICRNFMIYLEPDAQEKCIDLFHYSLRDGGYLFLGNAETVGKKPKLFKSIGHKQCRVYRKVESGSASRLPLLSSFAAAERSAAPAPLPDLQPTIGLVQEFLLEEFAPAAIAIDQNYDIVYHNGPTNRYLHQPRGVPTQNLLALLPETLRNRVRGGLYRAGQEGKPVAIRASLAGDRDRKRPVTLRISRVKGNLFVIVFREKGGVAGQEAEVPLDAGRVEETAIRQLENELAATRQDLQSHIEQLKSLNEELQSSNEELQAANEELETSREELQSLNEELLTVNSQFQAKIEEQEETNNDLNNFLASTNIPTIFLDRQFQVRRYTPAMLRLLKLLPSDVGRPIMDMARENLGPDLILHAQTVLESLVPISKEILINNAWYVRAVLPYRTANSRIAGVVITYTDISEMKRAEQRKQHLSSFPQFNPNPILEMTGSGVLAFSNTAAQTILESLGMDKDDPSAFLPHDIDAILRILEKKEEKYLYREVALKDRVFGEDVYVAPRFDVVRIYSYDITEIKKAAAVSGRLAAIVESAEDAIISKDLDGTITTWNRGAERIYGYTAAEAIGRHISFLAPPGHANEVTDILARIAHGEHIERFETERVRKDGMVIPVSLTFSAIKDERGRIIGASKIVHDVSDRKRAAEALRESEAKYRNLFANMTEEVYFWEFVRDEEGAITTWKLIDANPPALTTWGKTLGQIRGKTVDEIFGPGTTERYLPVVRKTMTEETPHAFEDFFPDMDRYYRFTSIPLGDRFIITGFDITSIKKAQRQSEHQRTRVEAVNQILHAGLTSKTDEELGESCLAAALAVTDSKFGFIGELGPDGLLRDIAISDMGWDLCRLDDQEGQRRAPGNFHIHGVYGRVLLDGEGFFTNGPANHPDSVGTAEGHPPLTAFLGVPLVREGKTVGMIAVANREGGYSPEEEEVLKTLAPAMVEAFSRKRAEEALRDFTEDLEKKVEERTRFYSVLARISEAMARIRDRQVLFDKVCRIVVEEGHFRLAWVGLLDPKSTEIQPVASAGDNAYLDGIRILAADVPEGQGPTGRAAHENRYIISNDFEKNPGMEVWRDRARAQGLRSSSAFPLHTGGKIVGVLTIYSDQPGFFGEEEVSLMAALAEDISFALDSMEIETRRSEAEEALRVLNEELDLRVKNRTAELQEVNNELEAFIYSVSHDLRAPLRTVSQFARMVRRDNAEKIDEQGRDYLTRVSKGAAKMSRLIEDLLYLSRITRQELVRSTVDLSQAARSIIEELRVAQPDRSVEMDIQPRLLAHADSRLIEVALSNLIGNAWKFTAKSAAPRIELGAVEKKGEAVYYVRDNGAGFNAKYAEKMFLPFQRLHSAREFEGTGIGLTIVERVIRRHGGRIWAEGEPGKGATVYFTLEMG